MQNATILILIYPVSIVLVATQSRKQRGIMFIGHFKPSSWQINPVLEVENILVHWTSFGMVTSPRSIVLVEFVTSPRHIIKADPYLNAFIVLVI